MSSLVLVKTVKISDDTHEELVKLGGELTAKAGKKHSLENVIEHLLSNYKKSK